MPISYLRCCISGDKVAHGCITVANGCITVALKLNQFRGSQVLWARVIVAIGISLKLSGAASQAVAGLPESIECMRAMSTATGWPTA